MKLSFLHANYLKSVLLLVSGLLMIFYDLSVIHNFVLIYATIELMIKRKIFFKVQTDERERAILRTIKMNLVVFALFVIWGAIHVHDNQAYLQAYWVTQDLKHFVGASIMLMGLVNFAFLHYYLHFGIKESN